MTAGLRSVRAFSLILMVVACLTTVRPAAQEPSVTELLDRYAAGEFDAVVAQLSRRASFGPFLKQLKDEGPKWIDAGGPSDRARRQVAAATFALEAARIDEWHEWKWTQKQPLMCPTAPPTGADPSLAGCFQPLNRLIWRPAPLLIEWGCDIFTADEQPRPIERIWQLAAVAVAQRGEDGQFLVGDQAIGHGVGGGEIINPQDEIKHLDHVQERFPNEKRFMLAQGIARFQVWSDDAHIAFGSLYNDPDVGAEAMMRVGEMLIREKRYDDAYDRFDRVERQTRDGYVIYLARYFRGQALLQQNNREGAESAFRAALAVRPRTQSGSTALAAVLYQSGRMIDAQSTIASMLMAPPAPDPWREFLHADDRFWPQLITMLRREIRP